MMQTIEKSKGGLRRGQMEASCCLDVEQRASTLTDRGRMEYFTQGLPNAAVMIRASGRKLPTLALRLVNSS